LMFTRSIYQTVDMAEQGVLLNEVARLVDAGTLRSTATERHAPINAANLKRVTRSSRAAVPGARSSSKASAR
jgi:NADPH2:quinone reductase